MIQTVNSLICNKIKTFSKLVIKHTCPICKEPSNTRICPTCLTTLPIIEQQCFQCGLPLEVINNSNTPLRCGKCVKSTPDYDICISPYHYALPINQFITQLKFHRQLYYAPVLAELLIKRISQSAEGLPDCIIPVPLHSSRLRARGFNQALEIARPIAKHFGIQVDTKSCRRSIATQPQMEQGKKAREKNIRNAFTVSSTFAAKHIAIVDDVMTTGQTVNEFAKILRRHGAERIQIWSAARA